MASGNKGSHPKGSANNKPTQRSSKKPRKPVTIDLEAAKVVSNPAKKPAAGSPQKTAAGTAPKPVAKQDTKQSVKQRAASAVPSIKSDAPKPKTASPVPGENKQDINKPAEKSTSGQANKTQSSQEKPPTKPQAKKADSKPTSKPEQNKKASASDNSGGYGKMFAGVLGGIIALSGAFLLQQSGIMSTSKADNSELSTKIAQIDEELKGFGEKLEASTQPGVNSLPDVKSLIARIAELEAQQKTSIAEFASQSKAVEAAVTKAESLQQSISSGAAGKNAALATLDERVKSLETSAADATGTASSELETQLDAVKKQISELSESVTSISTADNSQTTAQVKEAAAKFADLSAKITEISKSASDGQADTAGKISLMENSLGTVTNNLGALGARLEKVESIAAAPRKDEQRVARALAVVGLKSAIDGGGNFESALALVESLGTDTQATDPLKPFAATGVPTLSALESTFSSLTDEIVKSATPAENVGTMDKFFSNIRSLVTIKTTGVVEGNDPQAVVSRIKHGLENSDLEAVINEWGSLPDAAKTASGDWNERVKARHSANSLIENLLKQFMTGASGAGN